MRAYLLKYDVEEKTYEIVKCREYGLNTSIKLLVEYFKNLICAKIADEQRGGGCEEVNNTYKINYELIRDKTKIDKILDKINESNTFKCRGMENITIANISSLGEFSNKLYEHIIIFCDLFYFTDLGTLQHSLNDISDIIVEKKYNQLYVRLLDKTDNKTDTTIVIDGKSANSEEGFSIAAFMPAKEIQLNLKTKVNLHNIKLPDINSVIEFIESAKAVDFKNRFNWLSVITNS